MRRVVVTGMGQHTALGDEPAAVFDAILADATASVAMPHWARLADMHALVAAPIPGFDGSHIPRKVRRTMGRVALFAASAAEIAVRRAGLDAATLTGGRTAVVAGSSAGSGQAEEEFWAHLHTTGSARGLKSTLFFQAMAHTCATNIALYLGVTGEVIATNAACASSSQAIGVGAERIRLGRADVVIAGGAEELHLSAAVIFHSLQAASTGFNDRPRETPRPFDAGRDGIVVGEGAGMLVLEEREHALARGAPILAELLGFGTTCDAANMANPEPGGIVEAMRRCLADAGISAGDVDYVNAHATATRAGDAAEADAIWALFGDRVPVSSSKGHLGHTLGACGAIESILCIEAMNRSMMPGTRGLSDPDVAPIWLLRGPEPRPLTHVLNNSLALGGINSALLFRRADA